MRKTCSLLLTATIPALWLSACSKNEDAASETATEAAADAGASVEAGPGISGAVAPGVAFAYRYAFTLPVDAIATVQQRHAAACERLGQTRCRVTGMAYNQPREGQVQARIDFLLAPDLAHRFGTEGLAAVEEADGKLENASIQGEEAGNEIRLSQQNSAAIEAEIARLEDRLKLGGLTKGERIELQQQLASLREQLRDGAQQRRQKEAAIASTPVVFDYASEGLLGGNTFAKASSASLASAGSALSVLLLVAGIALPWIGLLALAWLAWRALRARVAPKPAEPAPIQG